MTDYSEAADKSLLYDIAIIPNNVNVLFRIICNIGQKGEILSEKQGQKNTISDKEYHLSKTVSNYL